MISRSAVAQYVVRPADNFLWMKELSEQDLDQLLSDINPPVRQEVYELNTAQKVCFLIGVAYGYFVFHLSMGTGKTRVTLELIRWYLHANKMRCGIILANTDEVVQGWEDEIIKWDIDIPYRLLLGKSREKWDILDNFDRGVCIATHVGFATMASNKVTREKIVNGEPRESTHWEPEHKRIDYLSDKFDAFVWDESTKVGNPQSLSYKTSRAASVKAKFRFALAGRLFSRDPMPVWAQFYLVDRGESFGQTLGLFREVFFTSKRGFFGGMEYKFNPKREPEFQRFLGHRSIYYDIEEVADLPQITRIPKYCNMPGNTEEYYKECIAEIIADKHNHRVVNNSFLKMRQISSGFIGMIEEEDEEEIRSEIEFEQNPKLDLLMDCLADLPENRKCVIFHEFTWSGRKICEALTKAKIQHGWLWGGTKDWDGIKNKFNNKPNFRHLVVSWRKGAYGLNLQAANYAFFYESPVTVTDREQCERRLRRQGQHWPVFVFDMLMRKTVDTKILEFHKEGRDIFKSLIQDPSQLLLDLAA
jgi:Type III restriction enzyme, res subunit